MNKIVLIIYGEGGELGSFEVFSRSLSDELSRKHENVVTHRVTRDFQFFSLLESIRASSQEIIELHIFSHAIGAGLFLGYKDRSIATARNALVANKRKSGKRATYLEVVNIEVGGIQTDDFKFGKVQKKQSHYQSVFSADATIKLWGCNSGVKGWVYNDGGIVDPKNTSVPYYWRAFNELNTPKPSIAQAMATFFNRKVLGANSGASIEVRHNRKWISSQKYKDQVGHWPSGVLPHRLVPDKGAYNEYLP